LADARIDAPNVADRRWFRRGNVLAMPHENEEGEIEWNHLVLHEIR